jgi:uncharacterized protein (TIGR04255 family)
MTNLENSIAKFDNPPIVEKLMGIYFEPLQQWSIPHFGLFWQEIKENFPRFSTQPSLLIPEPPFSGFQTAINLEDLVRCWFHHESELELIQVQRNSFIYNWQQPAIHKEYPYHQRIRPEFESAWRKFSNFLTKNKIDEPIIKYCEITYIDHLEKGREWENLSDLPNIIKCWSGLSGELLNFPPDLVTVQMVYSLPTIDGNLTILLQPAIRSVDSKEIIQITMRVTGTPASQNIDDILSWFDIGRDCILKSFIDLTTNKMHTLWGRQD